MSGDAARDEGPPDDPREALVAYDGSPNAATAIEVGARLLAGLRACVVHVWSPPFASEGLRRRLWSEAGSLDEFLELLEREGRAEADRVAAEGVALAREAGWPAAEPLVDRGFNGGLEIARLAERRSPAAVVAGSRGLGGVRAVLGSFSDAVVHFSPAPVLVVPHPLSEDGGRALAQGPVVVGDDGSQGARAALSAAPALLPGRELVVATAGDEGPAAPGDLPDTGAATARRVRLSVAPTVGRRARAVGQALAECAAAEGAAAIVVGSRGRSAQAEVLLGSVAMTVLHRAHRPVLVVPSGRRGHE
jgi:nucleotide-binding universal stress UspA family protein